MPITRLRSGRHRDPRAELLARQQAATGSFGHVSAEPSARTAGTGTSAGAARPSRRVATGARIIREAGGTSRDVTAWRSLSQQRRTRIRTQVQKDGGSLLKRIRRIQQRAR